MGDALLGLVILVRVVVLEVGVEVSPVERVGLVGLLEVVVPSLILPQARPI